MNYAESIETIDYRGYKIEIAYDPEAESPRAWDNLTKMICFHGRYDLGDKHDLQHSDYSSWDDMERYIRKTFKPVIMHELYLYDHSGLTISTRPFSCPWDSGQIGFLYLTRAAILEIYGAKRLSQKLLARAARSCANEISVYDSYLTGSVYRYLVTDKSGAEIDQCAGYYGDWETSGLVEDAKAAVDAALNGS